MPLTLTRTPILLAVLFLTLQTSYSLAANILTNEGVINMDLVRIIDRDLRSTCQKVPREKISQCNYECGQLYNPINNLAQTIDRKPDNSQAIKAQAQNAVKAIDRCYHGWRQNPPPPLRPLLFLATQLKSGNIPKPSNKKSKSVSFFDPPKPKVHKNTVSTSPAPARIKTSPSMDKNPIVYLDAIDKNMNSALSGCDKLGVGKAFTCVKGCYSTADATNRLRKATTNKVSTQDFEAESGWLVKYLEACSQRLNKAEVKNSLKLANYIHGHSDLFVGKIGILPVYNKGGAEYAVKTVKDHNKPVPLDPHLESIDTSAISNPFENSDGQARAFALYRSLQTMCQNLGRDCYMQCSLSISHPIKGNANSTSADVQRRYMRSSGNCLNALADKLDNVEGIGEIIALRHKISKGAYFDTDKKSNGPIESTRYALSAYRNQCSTTEKSDCYFACVDAQSWLKNLQDNAFYITPGVEKLTLKKIQACQHNSFTQSHTSFFLPLINQLEGNYYSEQSKPVLAKQNYSRSVAKIQMESYKDSDFKGFEYDKTAPFVHGTGVTLPPLSAHLTMESVLNATLTLENYCPESEQECCRVAHQNKPIIKLNALFDPTASVMEQQRAGKDYMEFGLLTSDDPTVAKALESRNCIAKWQTLPKNKQPEQVKILADLGNELKARKPTKGMAGLERRYCAEGLDNGGNPFYGKRACEYLSAIYYGDFENLANLELLIVQPMLANNEKRGGEIARLINNLQSGGSAKNLSMAGAITINYLLDYPGHYKACMGSDVKTYNFTDTKVTEYRTRYGRTLRSWTDTDYRSYEVKSDWVPYYEKLSLNLSEDGIALAEGLDKFMYQNTDITKMYEYAFGQERPRIQDIHASLSRFMSDHSCDSAEAKQMEKNLKRFIDFRMSI